MIFFIRPLIANPPRELSVWSRIFTGIGWVHVFNIDYKCFKDSLFFMMKTFKIRIAISWKLCPLLLVPKTRCLEMIFTWRKSTNSLQISSLETFSIKWSEKVLGTLKFSLKFRDYQDAFACNLWIRKLVRNKCALLLISSSIWKIKDVVSHRRTHPFSKSFT